MIDLYSNHYNYAPNWPHHNYRGNAQPPIIWKSRVIHMKGCSTKNLMKTWITWITTGRLKKTAQMFVCLISPEPMSRFLNRFFLLKTEIHMKILNTEPILCDFRGLRYLQNKMEFWNRQVHINNDLKWSLQHQSSLEMPKLAPDWPRQPLRT